MTTPPVRANFQGQTILANNMRDPAEDPPNRESAETSFFSSILLKNMERGNILNEVRLLDFEEQNALEDHLNSLTDLSEKKSFICHIFNKGVFNLLLCALVLEDEPSVTKKRLFLLSEILKGIDHFIVTDKIIEMLRSNHLLVAIAKIDVIADEETNLLYAEFIADVLQISLGPETELVKRLHSAGFPKILNNKISKYQNNPQVLTKLFLLLNSYFDAYTKTAHDYKLVNYTPILKPIKEILLKPEFVGFAASCGDPELIKTALIAIHHYFGVLFSFLNLNCPDLKKCSEISHPLLKCLSANDFSHQMLAAKLSNFYGYYAQKSGLDEIRDKFAKLLRRSRIFIENLVYSAPFDREFDLEKFSFHFNFVGKFFLIDYKNDSLRNCAAFFILHSLNNLLRIVNELPLSDSVDLLFQAVNIIKKHVNQNGNLWFSFIEEADWDMALFFSIISHSSNIVTKSGDNGDHLELLATLFLDLFLQIAESEKFRAQIKGGEQKLPYQCFTLILKKRHRQLYRKYPPVFKVTLSQVAYFKIVRCLLSEFAEESEAEVFFKFFISDFNQLIRTDKISELELLIPTFSTDLMFKALNSHQELLAGVKRETLLNRLEDIFIIFKRNSREDLARVLSETVIARIEGYADAIGKKVTKKTGRSGNDRAELEKSRRRALQELNNRKRLLEDQIVGTINDFRPLETGALRICPTTEKSQIYQSKKSIFSDWERKLNQLLEEKKKRAQACLQEKYAFVEKGLKDKIGAKNVDSRAIFTATQEALAELKVDFKELKEGVERSLKIINDEREQKLRDRAVWKELERDSEIRSLEESAALSRIVEERKRECLNICEIKARESLSLIDSAEEREIKRRREFAAQCLCTGLLPNRRDLENYQQEKARFLKFTAEKIEGVFDSIREKTASREKQLAEKKRELQEENTRLKRLLEENQRKLKEQEELNIKLKKSLLMNSSVEGNLSALTLCQKVKRLNPSQIVDDCNIRIDKIIPLLEKINEIKKQQELHSILTNAGFSCRISNSSHHFFQHIRYSNLNATFSGHGNNADVRPEQRKTVENLIVDLMLEILWTREAVIP